MKRLLGCFSSLLFLLISIVLMSWAQHCDPPSVRHSPKIGKGRCCQKIIIQPGFQAQLCNSNGAQAIAQACHAGYFQPFSYSSEKSIECDPHRVCKGPNMVTLAPGNSTHDTLCSCNTLEGYYADLDEALNKEALQFYSCKKSTPSTTTGTVPQNNQTIFSGAPKNNQTVTEISQGSAAWIIVAVVIPVVAILAVIVVVAFVILLRHRKKCCWKQNHANENEAAHQSTAFRPQENGRNGINGSTTNHAQDILLTAFSDRHSNNVEPHDYLISLHSEDGITSLCDLHNV